MRPCSLQRREGGRRGRGENSGDWGRGIEETGEGKGKEERKGRG